MTSLTPPPVVPPPSPRRARRSLGWGLVAVAGAVAAFLLFGVTRLQAQVDEEAARAELLQRLLAESLGTQAESAYRLGERARAASAARWALALDDSGAARTVAAKLASDSTMALVPLPSDPTAMAVTAGGAVAAGCGDGSLHLLDPGAGRHERLSGGVAAIRAIAAADSTALLAAGREDGAVLVWDPASGAEHLLGPRQARTISGLALGARGDLLASGSRDGTVQLWQRSLAGEGPYALVATMAAGSPVGAVVMSADGRLVAAGTDDGAVRLWQMPVAGGRSALLGHGGAVTALALSPDGTRLASAGLDQTLRLWDPLMGRPLSSRKLRVEAVGLAFGGHGKRLLATVADGSVDLYELDDSGALAPGSAVALEGPAVAAGLLPDGMHVAVALRSGAVAVVDAFRPARSAAPPSVLGPHDAAVAAIAFARDGKSLVTCGRDGRVLRWDVASGRAQSELTLAVGEPLVWALNRDGSRLALGYADGDTRLIDLASGEPRGSASGAGAPVIALAFGADGRTLAIGTRKGVRLWSAAGMRAMAGLPEEIVALSLTADGKQLLAASRVGIIAVLPVSGGVAGRPQKSRASEGETAREPLVAAALATKGRLAALATMRGRVLLLDTIARRERPLGLPAAGAGVQDMLLPQAAATALSFMPDGVRLVVGGADGAVEIWSSTETTERLLPVHRGAVTTVATSPDGKLVASGGADGTVHLWDGSGHALWRGVALLPVPQGPGQDIGRAELATRSGFVALGGPSRDELKVASASWRKVLRAARSGSMSDDGTLLCLGAAGAGLELWDVGLDRQLWRERAVAPLQIAATPGGCVSLEGEQALLRQRSGQVVKLCDGATAVGFSHRAILAACDDAVQLFSEEGRPQERVALPRDDAGLHGTPSAVLRTDRWVVVGDRRGGITLVPVGTRTHVRLRTEEAPAAAVTALEPGAGDVLAAGYADGRVVLWDTHGGEALTSTRLHGAVTLLRRGGQRLFAATELGDSWEIDLSVFARERCELLRLLPSPSGTGAQAWQALLGDREPETACSP